MHNLRLQVVGKPMVDLISVSTLFSLALMVDDTLSMEMLKPVFFEGGGPLWTEMLGGGDVHNCCW